MPLQLGRLLRRWLVQAQGFLVSYSFYPLSGFSDVFRNMLEKNPRSALCHESPCCLIPRPDEGLCSPLQYLELGGNHGHLLPNHPYSNSTAAKHKDTTWYFEILP